MGSFTAPVTTAFGFIETMQLVRHLRGELEDAEHHEGPLWETVQFWQVLANAIWVPRIMDIARQKRLEKLMSEATLTLHRNPLVSREESITAITPGILNQLRDRIATSMAEQEVGTGGQYSALADVELWHELECEAAIDYLFKSVQPSFEVRGCAQCGKWYEPVLANRGRFCSAECRKRFNNLRASNKDELLKSFECANCEQTLSMDAYSGLREFDPNDSVSPLRISKFEFGSGRWCADCVAEHRPEWKRYVAPIIDARERAAS